MRVVVLLLLIIGGMGTMSAAFAERRVALVIGNDRYPNLGPEMQLEKAVNDAEAIGDALASLGFEVIRGRDLGRQAMIDRLAELTGRLSPGDTAALFYAGHGIALGGVNYLVPSDIPTLTAASEARARGASIAEPDITAEIQARGVRVALVILDACRDNPFPRSGTRSVGATRGLADAKPARGIFTIYSAGIGQAALDRLGPRDLDRNSVFTRIFVEQLKRPGLHLGDLAYEVRERVAELALKAEDGRGGAAPHEQTPAYYDQTIGGRVYLAGRESSVPPAPASPPTPALDEVYWGAIKDSVDPSLFESFIRQFAGSRHATDARARLDSLRRTAVVPSVPDREAERRPPARPGTAFDETFGLGWVDAVAATPDGGYVLATRRYSIADPAKPDSLDQQPVIVRLDGTGRRVWEKAFPNRNGGMPQAVDVTPNGRIRIAGYSGFEFDFRARHLHWVAELDGSGQTVSDVVYGNATLDLSRRYAFASEGRVATIMGTNLTTGEAGGRLALLGLGGSAVWSVKMQDVDADCEGGVHAEPDGSVTVAVQIAKPAGSAGGGSRLRRFSRSGTLTSDRPIGTFLDGCPYVLRATPAGGHVVAGIRTSALGRTGWAALLDRDGATVWERDFGPSDDKTFTAGFDVRALDDGGALVAGCVNPEKNEDTQAIVIRFGRTGDQTGERLFAGQGGAAARALDVTPAGHVVVGGLRGKGCAEISGFASGGTAWAAGFPLDQLQAAR